MVKKCDVEGCKRKAEYFTPSFSYCFIHWQDLVREASKFGQRSIKTSSSVGKKGE